MPRGPRLDTPGTLHHVMVRGIERGNIFLDDTDRVEFLTRMGRLVKASGTGIYAFVLMSNHVHVLLKSGADGLPTFMRRLLSGYAQYFNRRHNRVGHRSRIATSRLSAKRKPISISLWPTSISIRYVRVL